MRLCQIQCGGLLVLESKIVELVSISPDPITRSHNPGHILYMPITPEICLNMHQKVDFALKHTQSTEPMNQYRYL